VEDGRLEVRAAVSREDLDQIGRIDVSYVTDRIYAVQRRGMTFSLAEQRVDPPLEKSYPRPSLELSEGLMVACAGPGVVGYGELRFEAWNNRARIEHLFVTRGARGRGVGRALVEALAGHARQATAARCLWLETQNVNYPAVQFYLRLGFQPCGLDQTLYAPGPGLLPGEVALYFARDLP
jgi:ribosomal protein S18 acetylase RimI-like enzyme